MSYIAGPIRPSSGSNSFSTVQPDTGTSPTATSSTDVLSLTSSDKSVVVDGNSGTDTIDFKAPVEYSLGTLSSNTTVDFSHGVIQGGTLGASLTFTFSNPGSAGSIYVLRLKDNGTGGFIITWPATVKWAGGTAPGATTASDAMLYNFYFDGTNYLSSFAVFPA